MNLRRSPIYLLADVDASDAAVAAVVAVAAAAAAVVVAVAAAANTVAAALTYLGDLLHSLLVSGSSSRLEEKQRAEAGCMVARALAETARSQQQQQQQLARSSNRSRS